MAVMLSNSPSTAFIHPVSNCLDVCLNTNSYLLTPSTVPNFQGFFDNSIVANGTIFYLFGQYFQTGNSNSYNTFIWDSSTPANTVNNLMAAFNKNALLAGRVTRFIVSSTPTETEAVFAWNELGKRIDFAFTGTAGFIQSFSQGSDNIYKNGYLINYELWQKDNQDNNKPILPIQSFTPLVDVEGVPTNACIDFSQDIESILKTTLFWDNTAPQYDTTCWGRFLVKYSDQQAKVTGCGIDYLGAEFTPTFEVCNAVCQINEIQSTNQNLGKDAKLADYIHTLNQSAKFFTSMPRDANGNIYVCGDEYMNLWFYLPQAETPNYRVEINCFNSNGSTIGQIIFGTLNTNAPLQRFLVIPIGAKNLVLPIGTALYTVEIFYGANIVSETLTFHIHPCGCEQEQVFFVCDRLGYDTMKFTRVDALSINVSQNEICLDVPCGGTVQSDLRSGLMQTNTVAYETFTLLSDKYESSEAALNWFIQFKKSESRYILRKLSDGTAAVFSLIIDGGDVQILQFGTDVQLLVTGRYGFDLQTQSEG